MGVGVVVNVAVAVGVGVAVAVGNGVSVGAGITVGFWVMPQADKAKPKDVVPLSLRKSRRDADLELFMTTLPFSRAACGLGGPTARFSRLRSEASRLETIVGPHPA